METADWGVYIHRLPFIRIAATSWRQKTGRREKVMEFEIQTTINHYCDHKCIDWPVVIYYEYDGGIHINGVWGHGDDTDHWPNGLTKEQQGHVEQACIDDYADRCDAAQAAADDRADYLYEQRKDRRLGNE